MTWYPVYRSVNDKVQKEQKSDKKYGKDYMKSTCKSSDYGENMCKVSKKISIKLYEELCSRGTHCLYIGGKVKKNNLTITSKSHAHPQTMKKTHAKFHNNWYKTVRGVALTSGTIVYILRVKND